MPTSSTTDSVPPSDPSIAPDRLSELLAAYADLKPQVDELADRLKVITNAIKTEATAANPGATKIDLTHNALATPLRVSYVQRWSLDAERMKKEDPALYVQYARQTGRWELRPVRG